MPKRRQYPFILTIHKKRKDADTYAESQQLSEENSMDQKEKFQSYNFNGKNQDSAHTKELIEELIFFEKVKMFIHSLPL